MTFGKADELLLALRVTAMEEKEAEKVLAEAPVAASRLDPRPQDVVMALELLSAWLRELSPESPRADASVDVLPALQLRAEARRAVEAAMEDAACRLPWPLYWRWRFERMFATAIETVMAAAGV